jgi:hypothetical protein
MASHPEYFENTRKANQHMTLNGAIRAADELGTFIDSLYPGKFHQRAQDEDWKQYHIGNRGMYVYTEPTVADSAVQVVAKDLKARDFNIEQILLTDIPNNEEYQQLWVRIGQYKQPVTTSEKDLMLGFDYRMQGGPVRNATLRIPAYDLVQRDDMAVFLTAVKRIEIMRLKSVDLVKKP